MNILEYLREKLATGHASINVIVEDLNRVYLHIKTLNSEIGILKLEKQLLELDLKKVKLKLKLMEGSTDE